MGDHNKPDQCPRCKHDEILENGLCIHCYPETVIELAGKLKQTEAVFGAKFDLHMRKMRREYIAQNTRALRTQLGRAKQQSHHAKKKEK